MEMPISVMIVLFVAIAVGILVLQLTGNIIGKGQEQIQQFEINCGGNAEFFIETARITPLQMGELIEHCYNENLGKYGGDKICYIVHGSISGDLTSQTKAEYIGKMDLSTAGKTVYIRFDELAQKVDITG